MEKKEENISLLINAAFYYLHWAFILKEEDKEHYRLVALESNRVIIDQDYDTFRGAKIGCAKTIRYRGFTRDLKTEWSPFFTPEEKWLKDKLKKCESM